MMRKLLATLTMIGLVALIAAACGAPPPSAPATPTPLRESPPTPPRVEQTVEPTASTGNGQTGTGKGVEVILADPGGSGSYIFIPDTLTFKAGETISFDLIGETEFHTFTVEELGIDEAVGGGETGQFTFTFDKPGTYTLICIPHEALGMVGQIIVEEGDAMMEEPGDAMSGGPKALSVTLADPAGGSSYAFVPDTLEFKTGETVNFTLEGEGEFHTFTVSGLGIDEIVSGTDVVQFSFTFDKPGTYQLVCLPHASLGMVGEIIVR
ncbi:MAG: cupredoxin domain-containing protein [Chloroflexi bacterium]|nr:cupredoxin domain-containing protein [Chloroflexota bacterium]